MGEAARKSATYQDVLDAPSNMVAEVLNGKLHLNPRPARRHATAASVLGMDLGGAFHRGRGGPGGWVILDEPELHLGADVVVPDLAGWRKERYPYSEVDEPYFEVVSDWVCEVLSPRTAKHDRTDKLAIYAREGVHFLWFVEPQLRTLEAMVLENGRWTVLSTFRDEAKVRVEPFDAIEVELAALWEA